MLTLAIIPHNLLVNQLQIRADHLADDEPSDSTTIIKKILSAKLFPGVEEHRQGQDQDTAGGSSLASAWQRSVVDVDGEILCGECPGRGDVLMLVLGVQNELRVL
jgi:hypothetical protein